MSGLGTELAKRVSGGVVVSLLWRRSDDRLTVVVRDTRTGEVLRLPASRENALDVFNHPYVYEQPHAA